MPNSAHTPERLTISLTPEALVRLAYSAGTKTGRWLQMRAQIVERRRAQTGVEAAQMALLRADAEGIMQSIGLRYEWPRDLPLNRLWRGDANRANTSSPRSRLTSAGDTHGTE
jgi:hypothetical protein